MSAFIIHFSDGGETVLSLTCGQAGEVLQAWGWRELAWPGGHVKDVERLQPGDDAYFCDTHSSPTRIPYPVSEIIQY